MAQTEEFMFQNVAYRPTVYRTGLRTNQIFFQFHFFETACFLKSCPIFDELSIIAMLCFQQSCTHQDLLSRDVLGHVSYCIQKTQQLPSSMLFFAKLLAF